MKDQEPTKAAGRRSLLTILWGGLGFIALAELSWVGLSFFKPRKPFNPGESEGVVEAGVVDNFKPGTVTPNRKSGFYLSRLESGHFLALSSRCSHLGCAISWNPTTNQFECPCHSSAFSIEGEVLRPPAPRPLDYFPVTIRNRQVIVHTGERKKRNRFNFTQAAGV